MATSALADARAKLKTALRYRRRRTEHLAKSRARVQTRVASPLHTQAPGHNQQPSRRRGLFNLEDDRRLLCSSFILALALEGLAYVVLIAVEE